MSDNITADDLQELAGKYFSCSRFGAEIAVKRWLDRIEREKGTPVDRNNLSAAEVVTVLDAVALYGERAGVSA